MVKCKDGREVRKGDWLTDTTGLYEVMEVEAGAGKLTCLREVFFDDNDEYFLDSNERWLTSQEIRQMEGGC